MYFRACFENADQIPRDAALFRSVFLFFLRFMVKDPRTFAFRLGISAQRAGAGAKSTVLRGRGLVWMWWCDALVLFCLADSFVLLGR